MTLSNAVTTYLERRKLSYRLVPHYPTSTIQQTAEATRIELNQLVRVILLQDAQGQVMAILPASHILDFDLLCKTLNRDLTPLYGVESVALFKDCEPGSRPPLPEIFGLPAVAEESLTHAGEIYFEAGTHEHLVCMDSQDFHTLMQSQGVQRGRFAYSLDSLSQVQEQGITWAADRFTPRRLKEGIQAIEELPAMPATAHQILKLRMNPFANAVDLARIVELDPSLAAQAIHWARSPLYTYGAKINSVRDAIRILGFDMVMNLALGIALGRSFRIPLDGPLGLNAFWRHSVYCAALVNELSHSAGCQEPGLAYLAGLLHNFGYLLLGQLFPAEFFLLNRFVEVNSHLPVNQVEHYVLGVEHQQIGAWLMQAWQMPEELIATVHWHHREDYSQYYAEYPNLVLIANRLLHRHGIGDECTSQLPALTMYALGITEDQALAALDKVLTSGENLDELSRHLSSN